MSDKFTETYDVAPNYEGICKVQASEMERLNRLVYLFSEGELDYEKRLAKMEAEIERLDTCAHIAARCMDDIARIGGGTQGDTVREIFAGKYSLREVGS